MPENENGREVKLASGASIYISVAPWREAKQLQDALARALNGGGITPGEVAAVFKLLEFRAAPAAVEKPEEAAAKAAEKIATVAALTRKALELASDAALERAIFACAERSLYRFDGTAESSVQFKLNAPGYGVFDDPRCRDRARGDYYAICEAVVEENLRPFAQALFSMFMARLGKSADIPESSAPGSQTPS